MLENKVNQTTFKATRAATPSTRSRRSARKLRAMMPWIAKNKLVDKARN